MADIVSAFSDHTEITRFKTTSLTIRSSRTYLDIPETLEYQVCSDREGFGTYVAQLCEPSGVSDRDGEKTRVDMDLPSAFLARFAGMKDSPVPAELDAEKVTPFKQIAAY